LPVERVVIKKEVVDSLLSYSQMSYPREGILLLRGKAKKFGLGQCTDGDDD